jgi:hypothetical protein
MNSDLDFETLQNDVLLTEIKEENGLEYVTVLDLFEGEKTTSI